MAEGSLAPFESFLSTLEQATNETQRREAFVVLAATGFAESELATDLALGAEYQVRFQSAGLIRRGAIDSFFGNLVIEFESDLKATRAHALEQLQGYVAGAWGEEGTTDRPFLAVATDGSHWEVFVPRLREPSLGIAAENVDLEASDTWETTGVEDAASLRRFLNMLFFRKTLLRPTTENFARDFGLTSPAYLKASVDLGQKLAELSSDPQLHVLRKAWSGSLQIAYGSVATDDELLVRHTYLAVLARLLVWASLERRPLEAEELDDVLSGKYFLGKRVANLVEDDYFRWHMIPSSSDANRVWIAISRHLAGYDLAGVREDILKPLYEQLVDPETRHDLGEYYTPDWLATLITQRLLSDWNWEGAKVPTVLDPTCGSGTFLRATIEAVRAGLAGVSRERMLDALLASVMGIDVHPLAVIVARATYLLAINDLIGVADRPVTIPVFLANSLRVPRLSHVPTLFGDRVPLEVHGTRYMVPPDFIHDSRDFDETIDDVMAVARSYGETEGSLKDVPLSFRNRVGTRLDAYSDSEELIETLGSMTQQIAELIRNRLDSVHGFMLRNHYRPAMLRATFDFVLGNPPWLTVSDIKASTYKELILGLAQEYKIAPRGAREQSHTEIATIFLCQAVNEFLRPSDDSAAPRVGLVMPRSIFNATHHRLLREGGYSPRFDVVQLWDLKGVNPLFNVPASVLFAAPGPARPERSKPGLALRGKLPAKDAPLEAVSGSLELERVMFEAAFLGKRSAWRVLEDGKKSVPIGDASLGPMNHYVSRFRQGAIIYPQTLFIVRSEGDVHKRTGAVRVRTDSRAARSARLLRTVRVNHVVEATNLFLTAAAEHILPYALSTELWTALLPTLTDSGRKGFAPIHSDGLRAAGRVETATWLDWAEAKWARVRKKSRDTRSLSERLDHLGQFSAQSNMKRYVVLYTAGGKRPVASFLDTKRLHLPFIARDKTYWASFSNAEEAHYLVGFLNSEYVADQIRDWMTVGLFGTRDIHKRSLDVPWPLFKATVSAHRELSSVAAELHSEASELVTRLPDTTLGRQRAWVRASLDAVKLARIEEIVEKVSRAVPPLRKEIGS